MQSALIINVTSFYSGYMNRNDDYSGGYRHIHGYGTARFVPQNWSDEEEAAGMIGARDIENIGWKISFVDFSIRRETTTIGIAGGLKAQRSFDPSVRFYAGLGFEQWVSDVFKQDKPIAILADMSSNPSDNEIDHVTHLNIGFGPTIEDHLVRV
mgnify:CR=1 FL=1